MPIRAAVLTISDLGARGERADTSGDAILELLASIDARVEERLVVPDEHEQIVSRIRQWADGGQIELVLTTGGTGLGPRDVTPEATAEVIERPVPGLGEAMRAAGLKHTPMAALSRGVAGVRGRCLIVNLPGSEKGVRENLRAVIDMLPHAIELLRGRTSEHPTQPAPSAQR
jgi:molybdenum cofactor synthesis domain-containing protein